MSLDTPRDTCIPIHVLGLCQVVRAEGIFRATRDAPSRSPALA